MHGLIADRHDIITTYKTSLLEVHYHMHDLIADRHDHMYDMKQLKDITYDMHDLNANRHNFITTCMT